MVKTVTGSSSVTFELDGLSTSDVYYFGVSVNGTAWSNMKWTSSVSATGNVGGTTSEGATPALQGYWVGGTEYQWSRIKPLYNSLKITATYSGGNISLNYAAGYSITADKTKFAALEEVTLTVSGGSSPYTWAESTDGSSYTTLSGSGTTMKVYPAQKTYYRCIDNSGKSAVLELSPSVMCSSDGPRTTLFKEDFGSYGASGSYSADKRRASSSYVPYPYYVPECYTMKNGGDYAIVTDPIWGGCNGQGASAWGCDCTGGFWYRHTYDHTQGGYVDGKLGGMLMLNCKDGTTTTDVLYQRTVDIACPNTLLNISLWVQAAWDAARGNDPVDTKFRLLDGDGSSGVELASYEINDLDVNEGWTQISATFLTTNTKVTIQFVNLTKDGNTGNDLLIDDIEFYACSPDAYLYVAGDLTSKKTSAEVVAPYNNGNHYDEVELEAVLGSSVISNPYYYWVKGASETATTWTEVSGASGYGDSHKTYAVKSSEPGFYKVAIGTDRTSAINVLNSGSTGACGLATVTNGVTVTAKDINLNLSVESDVCKGSEAQYSVTVTNPFDYEINNVNVALKFGSEGNYQNSRIVNKTSGVTITPTKHSDIYYDVLISKLPANGTVTFDYYATPAAYSENLRNTAKSYIEYIKGQSSTSCSGNNCMWNAGYDDTPAASRGEVVVTIAETCDNLSLSIQLSDDEICYGAYEYITFAVTNNDLSKASAPTGIQVSLPTQLKYVSCTGDGTYDTATGVINITSIPAGVSKTVQFIAQSVALGGGTIGSVLTTDHTKTASAAVTVVECEPSINMYASSPACYGATGVEYKVVLSNTQSVAMTNVKVKFDWAAGAQTDVNVTAQSGSYASGVWTIPTIAANSSTTLTYSYKASQSGSLLSKTWVTDYNDFGHAYTYDNSPMKSSASQTVNEAPDATIAVTGDAEICVGSTTYVTITPTAGKPKYSVVFNNGTEDLTIDDISDKFILNPTPTATTTYTLVSIKDANGCTSEISGKSATVSVDEKPVGSAGTDISQCNSGTFTLAGTVTKGSGVWTASSPGVIIADATSPVTTVSNVALNQTVTMTLTVSNGLCDPVTSSIDLTNEDCTDLTVALGDVGDICAGGDLNYKITVTNGSTVAADNVVVTYTKPDGTQGTKTFPSIASGANEVITDTYSAPVSTERTSKTISVTAKKDGGSQLTDSKSFYINPLPVAQTIKSSAVSYCAGGNVILGLNNSQSGVSYTLYRSNGSAAATAAGNGSAFDFSGRYTKDTYSVKGVYSATSCQSEMSAPITIEENSLPIVKVDTVYNKNCTAPFNGSYTIKGSAGTAPYLYSNDGGDNYSSQSEYTALETVVSIRARVKDANGCESTILSTELPNAAYVPTQFNLSASSTEYCADNSNSGVSLTLNGSESGFKYTLYNGTSVVKTLDGNGNALDFGVQKAGTYTVQAANADTKCSAEMNGTIAVTENALPVAGVSVVNNTRCAEAYNGSYAITATGGSGSGYTYSINGGAYSTVNKKTEQKSANDVVTVKDSKGCISAAVPAVILDSPVELAKYNMTSSVANNEYCEGSDGVILGLDGSDTGVSYTLNGGTSSVTVAGTGSAITFGAQKAGSYTVHAVNTTTGCEADMTGTITVVENERPQATATVSHNERCSEPYNGYYQIVPSKGSGNYSYSNNNGSTYTSQYRYDNISSANLYVKVKDSKGCVSDAYRVVVNNNAASLVEYNLYSRNNKTAFCANESGVELLLAGSEDNVTYELYKGGSKIEEFAGTGSMLNLGVRAEGTYTVKAVNALTGCTANMPGSVTLTKNTLPTADAQITNNTRCVSPFNGSYTIIATGGSGSGYTYSNDNGDNYSNNFNYPALQSANVQVKVKDGNGCESEAKTVVVEDQKQNLNIYNFKSSSSEFCEGSSVRLYMDKSDTGVNYTLYKNGNKILTVAGNGSERDLILQCDEVGTYNVVAENVTTGCTADMSGTVVLKKNTLPSATIAGTTAICSNDVSGTDLTFTVTDYYDNYKVTYKLSDGTEREATGTTVNVRPASTETYTIIKVEDGKGCVRSYANPSADQIATVTVDPAPSSNAGQPQIQFNNGTFTMSANQPATGETGTWSVVSITPSTASQPVIADASKYNTTVSGVDVNSSVVLKWTVTTELGVCRAAESTVTLNNVDGTDLALTSQFNKIEICATEKPQLTVSVVNNNSTDDAEGVVVTNAVTNAIVIRTVSVSTGVYDINTNTWNVGDVRSGQTAKLVVECEPSVKTSETTITSKSYVSLVNGISYASYDVAPAALKTTSSIASHAVPSIVDADVTTTNNISCNDNSLTGKIVVSSGYADYSFDGGTNWTTSNVLDHQKAGSYVVMVRNEFACVSNSIPVSVENNAVQPITYSVSGGGSYCEGEGSDVKIGVDGSQSGFSYSLYNNYSGQTVKTLNGTGSAIDFGVISDPGLYYVFAKSIVSSTCDAQMRGSAEVSINSKPTMTYKVVNKATGAEITAPYVITCSIPEMEIQLDGATGYEWEDGATSATRTISTDFKKKVRPVSEKGCYGDAVEIEITVNKETPKNVNITYSPADSELTLTCKNTEITLTASSTTADVTYKWNDAAATEGPALNVSDISAQSVFVVTVTAPNGCTSTDQVEIKENKVKPLLSVTSKDATGADNTMLDCNVTSLSLEGSVSNTSVVGVCTYNWRYGVSSSQSNPYEISEPGIYTVTATGANGCVSEEKQVRIEQNVSIPVVTINAPTDTLTCSALYNNIKLTALSTIAGSTFEWNTGETTAEITVRPTATHADQRFSVSATAPNGCKSQQDAAISIADKTVIPTIKIDASADKVTCDDVTLTASCTTCNLPEDKIVKYKWSDLSFTEGPELVINTGGTYTVTATNRFECVGTASIDIDEDKSAPQLELTPDGGIITCAEPVLTVTVNETSGLRDVSYVWSDDQSTSAVRNFDRPDTYTVTATNNATNCTTEASVKIDENKKFPELNLNAISPVCMPATVDIKDAVASSSKYDEIYYYDAAGSTVPMPSTIVNVTETTTYYVQAVGLDGSGCGSEIMPIEVKARDLSATPQVIPYDECPVPGKKSMRDLVTSDKTNLKFYDSIEGGSEVSDMFDAATENSDYTYYVSNTTKDQCESERAEINIHVDGTIDYDLIASAAEVIAAQDEVTISVIPTKDTQIEKYSWTKNGNAFQSDSDEITDILYTNSEFAVNASGRCNSITKKVTVRALWPTVIVPDGPGKNGEFARGCNITVFNRFNEKVFEGNDGWDGTLNCALAKKGVKADPGVYYYYIVIPDGSTQKGIIEVVKF
ncbi:MAG: hypothetical protein SPK61_00695 [Bacteroidales bacterium]|nr:hypothetical protein [Bacteroidales bacterium]